MFQFPGYASGCPMDSGSGAQPLHCAGFPIRTSPDQRLLTAPRGVSSFATSFFGSWRLGIHRALLLVSSALFALLRFSGIAITKSRTLSKLAARMLIALSSLSSFQGATSVLPSPLPKRQGVSYHIPLLRASAFFEESDGGAKRIRTADPLLARQVLSQLSYSPMSV
jgi:hypothetical protein